MSHQRPAASQQQPASHAASQPFKKQFLNAPLPDKNIGSDCFPWCRTKKRRQN
jgi:hypothetical protein